MSPPQSIHIDLDGAWPRDSTESYLDCRSWERPLRYSATPRGVADFYEFVKPKTARFTLVGSGDYHYLTALWLRRLTAPVTLVSFDNHPDWDIRPPRWCCGTWINRALELPTVRKAVIWGCGNFELNWPANLFVSRKALRAKRLEVWPWTERLNRSGRKRWPGMTRENWREKFSEFARGLADQETYVTVDLDSLVRDESTTNWENGLFQTEDIVWALGELRAHAKIIGGDLCGAYSRPQFARWKQRIEATLDRPRLAEVNAAEASARNTRAFHKIWTALTGRDERDAGADQKHAEP